MFLDEDLSSPRSSFAYASTVWTMNMNLVMPTFGIYMPGTVLYSTYSTESTLVGSHARGVKLRPRVSPHCPASFLLSFFAKLTAQVIPHSHYDAMSVHPIGGVWLNRKPIKVIKLKDIVKI